MVEDIKLETRIDYGTPDKPATVLIISTKADEKSEIRELIPEQAIKFAEELGANPKSTGIELEKAGGEKELVALPPEEVKKFAEGLLKVAIKAKELNAEKGLT